MAYVVDTTILIEYLLTGQYTGNARALIRDVLPAQPLYIPEFARLECVNVLWKYVRFSGLPLQDATHLVADLLALPFTIVDVEPVYHRALNIGLQHQLAVYDCIYIALAALLVVPLITLDARQAKAASAEGVVMKPITDFSP